GSNFAEPLIIAETSSSSTSFIFAVRILSRLVEYMLASRKPGNLLAIASSMEEKLAVMFTQVRTQATYPWIRIHELLILFFQFLMLFAMEFCLFHSYVLEFLLD